MKGDRVEIRPAGELDRRPIANLFAAVAEERDGIAAEPPIDVEERASSLRIDWGRENGLHKLTLSVFPHNVAAIALYRKFGLVEEGRRERQIRRADDEIWDLIEMGLQL
jgi:hypothetical protein